MNLDMQKRIASNLKVLRTCKGFSQAQIAEFVDISRSLYTHYELGRRTPDAEILFKIANRFGIDMGILFEAEPRNFLSHMASSQFCDDELVELTSLYRKLSPFSKGMLLERALYLLDWDRSREENRKALEQRKNPKKNPEDGENKPA